MISFSFSRSPHRPAAVAAAVVAAGLVATAVVLMPARQSRLWLLAGIALAFGLHVLLARAIKAVLSSVAPLASGAPEAAGYQRSVYGTPGTQTGQVVAMVAGAGLALGAAITLGWGWLGALALLAVVGAVGLDLHRWERVAASADWVWFQRGFLQKAHQVAIENIRDTSVHEEDAAGFTLRHGTRNRTCRLNLRMNDKRIVALPKTDAFADLDAVEAVANHIRSRQALTQGVAEQRQRHAAPMARPDATPTPAAPPVSPDADEEAMQRELRRLRRAALTAAKGGAPRPPGGDRG